MIFLVYDMINGFINVPDITQQFVRHQQARNLRSQQPFRISIHQFQYAMNEPIKCLKRLANKNYNLFFNAEQSYTEIYFSMNAIESNSAVTYSKTTVTRTFDEH